MASQKSKAVKNGKVRVQIQPSDEVERQSPYVQPAEYPGRDSHTAQGGVVGGGSASSATTGATSGGPVTGGGTPSGGNLPEYNRDERKKKKAA